MSKLDSFFNKGFKAAKCKTLLKLSIPRIKLLRNRREIQIKQMRRDIAKLLETGQEATARIRVEHIIREENMMAAQEIIELFCELISVRLPIIEVQRECPLDLKEAISSVCFAAPRCADLLELLQVQMLFAMKYGKEFVAAATELMPECGVNRQLIELLSIRAPSPEKKLKLLKEIAEEHKLDWDPAASETELMKLHEDLLNGPTQFVSGSKMPLPKEKHDETLSSGPDVAQNEQPDLDAGFDPLDFPEVPRVSLRPSTTAASTQESSLENPNVEHELLKESAASGRQDSLLEDKDIDTSPEDIVATPNEVHDVISGAKNERQFLPFLAPPSVSSTPFAAGPTSPTPSISRTKSEVNVDLQDVLVAAQAAAETAERAAAAARSAASLAQARISELTKRNSEKFPENVAENPFYADIPEQPAIGEKPELGHQHSFVNPHGIGNYVVCQEPHKDEESSGLPDIPSFDKLAVADDSHISDHADATVHSQPQRLPSMDDESYFSYPNLFTRQSSNLDSSAQSVAGNSHSTRGI